MKNLLLIFLILCMSGKSISQNVQLNKGFEPAEDDDLIEISIVGNANVQKAVSEGAEFEANTGVGVMFKRYWPSTHLYQTIEFDFNVNVFSTADTISAKLENGEVINRREFGNYLLLPRSSRQAADIKFNVYFGNQYDAKWVDYISGLHFELLGSNSVWNYDNQARNVAAFSFKAGIFHDFIPDDIRVRKKYSIIAGINYTERKIRGDIATDQNDIVRNNILGSSKVVFKGIETHFCFKLNNIKAELRIPLLKADGDNVPGLTGTQMTTGISFIGGVPLEIFEKKKS